MEDILMSIMNGQRKQALNQLALSNYDLEDLFEAIEDEQFLESHREIVVMYKIAVSTGFIVETNEIN